MGEGENEKAILMRDRGGSAAWERMPYFYATAGDIQAKPTRVIGGFDFLVFFYSGAVRGLLIGRSQQAIYRIVRNGCGYKTTLSDFQYVISGLNGEPKSASFFAF